MGQREVLTVHEFSVLSCTQVETSKEESAEVKFNFVSFIKFEEVRNGSNFPFNRKDSTYTEAMIPKISCLALKMAAL